MMENETKKMPDCLITHVASECGLPVGWYDGSYFDGEELKIGLSPQMRKFAHTIFNLGRVIGK